MEEDGGGGGDGRRRDQEACDTLRCVFGRRSQLACGSEGPAPVAIRLQTLDELDAAATVANGSGTAAAKVSWIILSRVGVDYLGGGPAIGRWLICPAHRRELLEAWQAPSRCGHPSHEPQAQGEDALGTVTLATSLRALREEGVVLAIGGRLCAACTLRAPPPQSRDCGGFSFANGNVGGHLGPFQLIVPSPFCPPPDVAVTADASGVPEITLKTEVVDASEADKADKSQLVTGAERAAGASITIKEEPTEYVVDVEGSPQFTEVSESFLNEEEERRDHDPLDTVDEDDEESLFSEDSDLDRTWVPALPKKKAGNVRTRRTKRGRPNNDSSSSSSSSSSEDENEVDEPEHLATDKTAKTAKTKKNSSKPKNAKKSPKKPPAKKPKKQTSHKNGPMATKVDADDASSAASVNDDNKSYFCGVCQISFYKRSSYLQVSE
jgi:hypothetical protein